VPGGATSPVHAVPELVAVAVRGQDRPVDRGHVAVGEWQASWTAAQHAEAVSAVREAIARGDVYQANVVGHRSAAHRSAPRDVALAVAGIGATYAGVLTGEGWAVGCASPEQLVRVDGRRITTEPIKGTRRIAPGALEELRASGKDRAEHVMIVDLERNDLARVAVTGSVEVESLYDVAEWAGLWQAGSTVAAELLPGAGVMDVLRAVLPGGSVTGAPKRAACALLASLEPVGRGPAMGAFGVIRPGGLDLGLTIRTVGVDSDRVHLWAGGGITWGSDPDDEVAEAEAKAGPVMRALGSGA
jgi:para-aminobenzoate synthetase component 1